MSEVKALGTHYMIFPYSVSGLTLGYWTTVLLKNGERLTDVAIECRENPTGVYTFSFDNDGDDEAQWSLVVYETSGTTGLKFGQSWTVRKRIVEQNVKQIRSRMDSDGGYFQSSINQEK
jgi:hypothetical protein